ncbi:MAG: AzlD domain-containing protein [Thermodesulfobacteriota bacterium]
MPGYDYAILVLAMGIVTYVPRWAPLFLLTSRRLSDGVIEWLDLIPAAILSALLLPALLLDPATRRVSLLRPELLVAVPTFLIACKTKSLGGTVVAGMMLYWLAGRIF